MKTFGCVDRSRIVDQVTPEFFAETHLAPDACRRIFRTLCNRLFAAGAAVSNDGVFNIGCGRIWLRLNGGDLNIQVFAQDILTFIGIRTMLEGYLHEALEHPPKYIRWHLGREQAHSWASPNSRGL